MVDPIDDIARQARQGSVSAIIQVLNEKLANAGVRTRAVLEQGVLQLLCEAAKPEQLEQPVLVPQIRQILESLQPRRIRRVNINSRIVREQQLLWLDEINRDPEQHLLWSEEITLKKLSPIQRWLQDGQDKRMVAMRENLLKAAANRPPREKRVFWRGLIGGASLSVFLLLVGWAVYQWLNNQSLNPILGVTGESATAPESPIDQTALESPGAVASPAAPSQVAGSDPFSQAVNLAQQAVATGQTAQTSAQWLALAAQWQQASDLMAQIPPNDPRYETAQSRVQLYEQNSEMALQRAAQVR